MAYHLRYQSSEWALHHVVSRCINGYSFLKPTPAIVQICTGVLGRALAMYSTRIKLIHMAFLSNHFHLLLESESVHALSQFTQYLKSNLSRELAREVALEVLHERRERVNVSTLKQEVKMVAEEGHMHQRDALRVHRDRAA